MRASQAGFTVAELMIALFLMSLVLVFVLPAMGRVGDRASPARQLIGAVRSAALAASSTNRPHRLHVDLETGRYWVTMPVREREEPSPDPTVAGEGRLPPGIRFQEVTTVAQGRIGSGQAFVQFSAMGHAEPAAIRLAQPDHRTVTLLLDPLTSDVRPIEGNIELTGPVMVPERIRPLLAPTARRP